MAFSKVGQTSAAILAGAGSQAIALPGGLMENDMVIVAVAGDVNCANAVTTAGYNILNNSISADPGRHLAWKRMGATPDSIVSIARNALIRRAAIVQAWRGADIVTAIDAIATPATGASGDPDAPALATVTNAALRIVVGYLDDDDTSTVTAPSGYTDLLSVNTGLASLTAGATVMMASKAGSAIGSEDPAAFVTGGDDAWAADHFALRGQVVPGPFNVEAGGSFVPGAFQAETFVPGAEFGAGQVYVAGSALGGTFVAGVQNQDHAQTFVAGAVAGQTAT